MPMLFQRRRQEYAGSQEVDSFLVFDIDLGESLWFWTSSPFPENVDTGYWKGNS